MRTAGKLTDRFGAGIAVTAGLALSAIATLPFVFMGADMILIQVILLLREIGLGLASMPLMSALSHATAEVNILRRVAGALGSAIPRTARRIWPRSRTPSCG